MLSRNGFLACVLILSSCKDDERKTVACAYPSDFEKVISLNREGDALFNVQNYTGASKKFEEAAWNGSEILSRMYELKKIPVHNDYFLKIGFIKYYYRNNIEEYADSMRKMDLEIVEKIRFMC